jgi:hypothetical protein
LHGFVTDRLLCCLTLQISGGQKLCDFAIYVRLRSLGLDVRFLVSSTSTIELLEASLVAAEPCNIL